MNETLKNKEIIRDYLLCRISDEEKLSEIEEFLFSDDEFRTELETVLSWRKKIVKTFAKIPNDKHFLKMNKSFMMRQFSIL